MCVCVCAHHEWFTRRTQVCTETHTSLGRHLLTGKLGWGGTPETWREPLLLYPEVCSQQEAGKVFLFASHFPHSASLGWHPFFPPHSVALRTGWSCERQCTSGCQHRLTATSCRQSLGKTLKLSVPLSLHLWNEESVSSSWGWCVEKMSSFMNSV